MEYPRNIELTYEQFNLLASKEIIELFDKNYLNYSDDNDCDERYFYCNPKYWSNLILSPDMGTIIKVIHNTSDREEDSAEVISYINDRKIIVQLQGDEKIMCYAELDEFNRWVITESL